MLKFIKLLILALVVLNSAAQTDGVHWNLEASSFDDFIRKNEKHCHELDTCRYIHYKKKDIEAIIAYSLDGSYSIYFRFDEPMIQGKNWKKYLEPTTIERLPRKFRKRKVSRIEIL
jgi:hypothetical protein